jgi:CRISPR-associated protein Cmr3
MNLWAIEPRDPLLVRDGRPNEGRSESSTLSFPYPGTVAGLVRTRLGSDEAGAFTLHDQLDTLLAVTVRGPLLVSTGDGEVYVAPPRDALMVADGKGASVLLALHPIEQPDGAVLDDDLSTAPVGLDAGETLPGKPSLNAPAWWSWKSLATWLVRPAALTSSTVVSTGLRALPLESRMHVKLGATETAEEGKLFGTDGIRYTAEGDRQLALLVDVGEAQGLSLRPGVAPAAGERRLVRWAVAKDVAWPACPPEVERHVGGDGDEVRVRVVLLTPALFEDGWRPGAGPGGLLGERGGVQVSLTAACTPRPQTLSGWDFAKRQPKPTRRAVGAGSVFWLTLRGNPEDRLAWLKAIWMTNVSDRDQDRRDGYGLAVVGVAR